jgi:hypothetical protein
MPPYHIVTGNAATGFNITIYLRITSDSGGLASPADNIFAQVVTQWGPITNAHNLNLTFSLSTDTPPLLLPPPPGISVTTISTPPGGVEFFNLVVGGGAQADRNTRSGRISYVRYKKGEGYLYVLPLQTPTFVPDISHELGHILGLTDRYYEAIYWLTDMAINRTCMEIRKGLYIVGTNDFRDGVAGNGTFVNSPRLAVRVPLPMDMKMIPGETAFDAGTNPNGYVPCNNLMSIGTSALSAYQVSIIVGKDKTGQQLVEDEYRKEHWVALLGALQRNAPAPADDFLTGNNGIASKGCCDVNGPDYPVDENTMSSWIFPTWESNPQARPLDAGTGLLFLRIGDNTPRPYPCLSPHAVGRDKDGKVNNELRISITKAKKRLHGSKSIADKTTTVEPDKMCYVVRMLNDLLAI